MHSALVFVRDIPKRKWSEQKQEAPSPTYFGLRIKAWKSIGEWAFMLIVFVVLWQFQSGNLGSKECPDLVRGNPEGATTVQYFYSPFCPACWKGERFLQGLVAKYPQFRFENFDARYCQEVMLREGVRGSPAFHVKNASQAETVYGVDAERVEQTVCSIGDCL